MTYLLAIYLVTPFGETITKITEAPTLAECRKQGKEEAEKLKTDRNFGNFVCVRKAEK